MLSAAFKEMCARFGNLFPCNESEFLQIIAEIQVFILMDC